MSIKKNKKMVTQAQLKTFLRKGMESLWNTDIQKYDNIDDDDMFYDVNESRYIKRVERYSELDTIFNICPSCYKPAKLECQKCKSVYYCNEKCRLDDIHLHKKECEDVKSFRLTLLSAFFDIINENFLDMNGYQAHLFNISKDFLKNKSGCIIFHIQRYQVRYVIMSYEDGMILLKKKTPPHLLQGALNSYKRTKKILYIETSFIDKEDFKTREITKLSDGGPFM